MKRKFIDRPFQVKSTNADGTFSGYGSVFGEIDSYRDIVVKGAFSSSLAEFKTMGRAVPMLWQHDGSRPIGIYTSIKEDDHGLLVEGECNMDVQQGREAHALMKQGALTGLSIGYSTERDEWSDKTMTRSLLQVKLWEISPVTFPAGDGARVSQVKSIEGLTTLSDVEKNLRDAGYSRNEALALVATIKGIAARSDSAGDDQAVLNNLLQSLRTN